VTVSAAAIMRFLREIIAFLKEQVEFFVSPETESWNGMKTLDCSGASPILISSACARKWRGVIDASTGEPCDLNIERPSTHYDRACLSAFYNNGIVALDNSEVLVLFTDSDCHIWLPELNIIMCGNWLPSSDQLASALWANPLMWRCMESYPLLCNSATDLSRDLNEEGESIQTTLLSGNYLVDSTVVSNGTYSGTAHRFRLYSN